MQGSLNLFEQRRFGCYVLRCKICDSLNLSIIDSTEILVSLYRFQFAEHYRNVWLVISWFDSHLSPPQEHVSSNSFFLRISRLHYVTHRNLTHSFNLDCEAAHAKIGPRDLWNLGGNKASHNHDYKYLQRPKLHARNNSFLLDQLPTEMLLLKLIEYMDLPVQSFASLFVFFMGKFKCGILFLTALPELNFSCFQTNSCCIDIWIAFNEHAVVSEGPMHLLQPQVSSPRSPPTVNFSCISWQTTFEHDCFQAFRGLMIVFAAAVFQVRRPGLPIRRPMRPCTT